MSVPITEYWLISAPGDKTPQNTFERLNQATKSGGDKLSENFKFNIPDLKVADIEFNLKIFRLSFGFNFCCLLRNERMLKEVVQAGLECVLK